MATTPDLALTPVIRIAHSGDIERLRAIEIAAGRAFRDLGMAAIADDPPPSDAEFTDMVASGLTWVALVENEVVAYLSAEVVDGTLHIAQVSVHPDAARRAVGRALIDHAGEVCAARGLAGLTLTTFRDVPWNAPYYSRLGFRVVPESDVTPELRAIRRTEMERGLDQWPRVCMRRSGAVTEPDPGLDGVPFRHR